MSTRSWLLVLVLASCTTGPPPMPRADAGQDSGVHVDSALVRDDVGAVDGGVADAASIDGGSTDAGSIDAASDVGSIDAGHGALDASGVTPPVVDGVIGATEWASATTATSTTTTTWTGNQLTALHAIATGGTLYLAIEGQVASFNGMIVYLDGDPGGTTGIADLSTLTDSMGALDNVISAGFTTPATDRWDLAWGTTAMSHSIVGADDTTGFRDITSTPSNFGWIVASTAHTVCSATACEASIPTSMLPGASLRTIAMFARIADSMGLMSPNQTLPMDDGAMPRVVSVVTTITEM